MRLALAGGHIPTVALTHHYMVVFAAVGRDLDRATPHAQALLDLGLTHGLPSWHGFAKFTLAWASRRHNPQALVEMRAALALLEKWIFASSNRSFGTLLAEAAAAAGELGRRSGNRGGATRGDRADRRTLVRCRSASGARRDSA